MFFVCSGPFICHVPYIPVMDCASIIRITILIYLWIVLIAPIFYDLNLNANEKSSDDDKFNDGDDEEDDQKMMCLGESSIVWC